METRKPSEFLNTQRFAVFDLDGVVMRMAGHHRIDPHDYAAMIDEMRHWETNGGRFSVVTNRGPAEMDAVAYFMGMDFGLHKDAVWITESGGSEVNPASGKSRVAEAWKDFAAERVPELREYLVRELGVQPAPDSFDAPQFRLGQGYVKTVLLPPSGIAVAEYAAQYVNPALEAGGFADFKVKPGKAVDIDPAGLSKEYGMARSLEANGIDASRTPTLFIADHHRDIAAASALLERAASSNTTVAAVANADQEYMDFVREQGGIVAPEDTSYHSSVAHILREFSRR